MTTRTPLSRREFLKLFQANVLAAFIPADLARLGIGSQGWPALEQFRLPVRVRSILERVPPAIIDPQGFLVYQNASDPLPHRAPTTPTLWNKLHSHASDRLDERFPWGIVLHWYGDKEHFDRTIPGYLNGFDSLRKIEGYDQLIRTSAHFLVGDEDPLAAPITRGESLWAPFGVLQTQLPDRDGVPFAASHLRSINYQAIKDNTQYFVRALSHLNRLDPANHSLLQDLFLGPRIDPNQRTIAIEITGHNFDLPAYAPSAQKIANVVGLVWALMKRYAIPASRILGHHELSLGKPDPGKKFLALVRYLIGVKALVEADVQMKRLVFGQYLEVEGGNEREAALPASKYFRFLHDYQALISPPRSVYEWETWSNFWLLAPMLGGNSLQREAGAFIQPLDGLLQVGVGFLNPANHEGVDLMTGGSATQPDLQAILVAEGECLFTGKSNGHCPGKMTIFRHYQPDGARTLTVFNHLNELANLQAGQWYPPGTPVGTVEFSREHRFLHFAVAYGSTWETDLYLNPDIPRNAGPAWIRQRYLDPVEYAIHYSRERPETTQGRYESW